MDRYRWLRGSGQSGAGHSVSRSRATIRASLGDVPGPKFEPPICRCFGMAA